MCTGRKTSAFLANIIPLRTLRKKFEARRQIAQIARAEFEARRQIARAVVHSLSTTARAVVLKIG